MREQRLTRVIGDDGVARGHAEPGHARGLATVFGPVTVERFGYRAKGAGSRFVADARLNLPGDKYSHGLRRLAAQAAVHGSFEQAQAAIEQATGVKVGKRQVQQLVAAAAVDVDGFYATREHDRVPHGEVLVLTADAKGIVMRPQALRDKTASKATSAKLATRLSKGDKRGRKRMAEVVAVYHCTPVPRSPADVIGAPGRPKAERRDGPHAVGKWLHASVTDDAATVISAMFDQAHRVDPDGSRPWVARVSLSVINAPILRLRTVIRTTRRPAQVGQALGFRHGGRFCVSVVRPSRDLWP